MFLHEQTENLHPFASTPLGSAKNVVPIPALQYGGTCPWCRRDAVFVPSGTAFYIKTQ